MSWLANAQAVSIEVICIFGLEAETKVLSFPNEMLSKKTYRNLMVVNLGDYIRVGPKLLYMADLCIQNAVVGQVQVLGPHTNCTIVACVDQAGRKEIH